jgi:hypothetical protein
MGVRRFRYSAEGNVSPQRFIAALTDFSDRRPHYWPGMTRNQYKLIEQGEDWALVREGTLAVWELARYDWSKPGLVVSTMEDSNFCRPGTTWTFRVKPRKGGGCRVEAVLERDFTGLRGWLPRLGSYSPLTGPLLAAALRRTLQILENE